MRLFQVDSFTDRVFKGNPAGVLLSDEILTQDFMQNMANEMNLSETAFVYCVEGQRIIKFFTPTVEVDLCGHATLATCHVLWEEGIVQDEIIELEANKVTILAERKDGKIQFRFPVVTSALCPIDDYCDKETVESHLTKNNWQVSILENEDAVKTAVVKLDSLVKDEKYLILSSRGDNSDFVLRVFAPLAGIPEDPVTGYAQAIVSPIWSAILDKQKLHSYQVSTRCGEIWTEIIGDEVLISGNAKTVFEAKLKI
jgi:PhzF family phenazine biosynthesis protein